MSNQPGRERRKRRKRARDASPRAYSLCDAVSGALIYFLVVFTPWAFGTTQSWSIWTANLACYALGLLWIAKAVIRWQQGFQPPRWDDPEPTPAPTTAARRFPPAAAIAEEDSTEPAPHLDLDDGPAPRAARQPAVAILAVVTFALLAIVGISLLNARGDFNERTRELTYLRESIAWLPHTYDRSSTVAAFAQYLGLAAAFWAIRDWLRYRTPGDRKELERASESGPGAAPLGFDSLAPVPSRLRRLLWVLCLSGALLAVMGILQRAAGTNKLLFLLGSRSNKPATSVFGPWSYRSNAAEYFNLLWPACLGFWLWLQERANRSADRTIARFDGPQLVLVPCLGLMAAAPTVSTSRAAAALSAVLGVVTVGLLLLPATRRQIGTRIRYAALFSLALAGLAALVVGGSTIRDRVAAADTQHPTSIKVGPGDFTLVARVRLAEVPRGERRPLLGLAANPPGTAWLWNYFELELQTDGSLYAAIKGGSRTNVDRLTIPDFVSRFGGPDRDITLAAVRANGLRLFVDGQPLEGTGPPPVIPPNYVDSAYVFAHPKAVSGVALLDLALSDQEIRDSAKLPLADLVQRHRQAAPVTVPNENLAPALTLPDGVAVSTGIADGMTTLKRGENAGLLGFRWTLPAANPDLRGRVAVSFTARNPGPETLVLGVNVDAGSRSLVEVLPGEEETVTAVCRLPHRDAARQVDVVVIAPASTRIRSVPAGGSFALRDLRIAAAVEAMHLSLEEQFSFDSLRLRMTGRPEILANARRMAVDYPVWGSGAGTFATLYDLYRQPHEAWAGYVHNDWLETRITLGWVGLALVSLGLLALACRSWSPHGPSAPGIVVALLWTGLVGCLVHAIGDFPFQIYSVLFLFVTLGAIASFLSGRAPGRRSFR